MQEQRVNRFKLRDAARRHGLTHWQLRQAVRDRQVEHFKIGNRVELTDEAVIRFLENARHPALRPAA